MFTINFKDFTKYRCFLDFKVYFMPGISSNQLVSLSPKCILNIDERTAYVYID